MDLQLAPPHDAWDALTQSWITELPQAALARAQAVPAASLTKAKLSISPPPSKPSPPWVPPPVVTPQVPAAEAAPPAAASGSEEVPMTPEAQEASSLALAWRLQQEEQAAFYHAIHENTPGPTARSIAATPGEAPLMGALGEPESPEDASLQLALRLQQARSQLPLSPAVLPCVSPAPSRSPPAGLPSIPRGCCCAGGAALAADAVAPDLHGGDGRRRSRRGSLWRVR